MNKYGEIKTTISEDIYFLHKNKGLLILWFLFLNLEFKIEVMTKYGEVSASIPIIMLYTNPINYITIIYGFR